MKSGLKKNILVKPELLSPAGSWDCLAAAVTNGADAVYLGTREFNARVNARNFSLDELARAISYGHSRGVRLYLTLNTLVKNNEIKPFFNVLSKAYLLGIDGVIIQHLSFLEIIKKNFPGLAVFVSTQGAIGNASSTGLVKTADRVILPRELPMEEVKYIIESGVKVEVFVHGALCFSYSGLCLFSSFVSNRSGNRGSCAQLCRKKYNGAYLLSTKELCLVKRIPELIQAGISGFKIEGRMRSALYVAVATRLYRKAIDSFLEGKFAVPEKEMSEMEVVFNREFTDGFIFGARDLISSERPMNRGAFLGVIEKGEITVTRPVAVGDGVGIWGEKEVTGAVIKEINIRGKKEDSAETGRKINLGIEAKEGARIYLTSSKAINIEPEFKIEKQAISTGQREKLNLKLPSVLPVKGPENLKLLVKVYSMEEAKEAAQAGADTVFYNIFASDFPSMAEWKQNSLMGAYLPRIMNDKEISQAINLLRSKKPGAVLTGNIGFLVYRDEFPAPVYLDYSTNCFNDLDLSFFRKFNAVPVLSPELSLQELSELKDKSAVVFAHGDMVLMNTKIELAEKGLADEMGFVFPVRKESGYWQLLNSLPYGMFSDIKILRDAGFNRFLIDAQNNGSNITALYRKILSVEVSDRRMRKRHTSGHLFRPVP